MSVFLVAGLMPRRQGFGPRFAFLQAGKSTRRLRKADQNVGIGFVLQKTGAGLALYRSDDGLRCLADLIELCLSAMGRLFKQVRGG